MEDMGLEVQEENVPYVKLVEEVQDLRDGQPFPVDYHEPLRKLWEDPNVQKCWERGNEAALPEKYALTSIIVYCAYSTGFSQLDLLLCGP